MSLLANYHSLIDQSHSLLSELINNLAADLLHDVDKRLEENIEKASSNQANITCCEDANTFHKNKAAIQASFFQQVANGFEAFKENNLSTHIKENDFHNEAWSLLDDDILEETISISTYCSEMGTENKDKLWQLHERLSYMCDETSVDESNNPLSPVQFFVALRFGLKSVPLNIQSKLSAYQILGQMLQQQYPTIINKINAFLISKNILPELNYEKHHKVARPGRSESSDNTLDDEPTATETEDNTSTNNTPPPSKSTKGSSQIPLVNTIRGLLKRARNIKNENDVIPIEQKTSHASSRSHQDHHSTAEVSHRGEPVVFDTSQIVEAVEEVQHSSATAHFFSEQSSDDEILQVPTNIAENSSRIYNELHKASPDGAINAHNMYTIDMVGMLFEYILADEKLPDSIKTLLSHLHTPFLKLAFLDSDFFENKEHKSRMLLDSLADAGASWVHHDGTAQYDMYNEIKHVVQRAIKEFKNDVNLFAELLMEFNILKKRVGHMHNLRERNSIEKKQGQEKHEQAKALARQEIKNRIEGRRVPSSIISLLSPWFTYLTFIQLKEGKDSKTWHKATNVIDNLITYCSIKTVKQDTTALAEGFDTIIAHVQEGLTHVAYNETKASSIMSELKELKNSVLNKRVIKTTKATDSSKKKAAANGAAITSTPTPEEERVMNYIKLIEPGTWIEYDNKSRFKVNGFNSEAHKYVLVDQSSQEVTMVTRLEFARDILSERATLIDGTAKPLFERALERIHQNLDKQVQVSAIR